MLTLTEIKNAVNELIAKYPIRKISLFGSYAQGTANENSDIDFLVEFLSPYVSLLMINSIKYDMQCKLNKNIDIIHAPLDENSLIKIDKVIDVYEQ